jgi:hypothetical protein
MKTFFSIILIVLLFINVSLVVIVKSFIKELGGQEATSSSIAFLGYARCLSRKKKSRKLKVALNMLIVTLFLSIVLFYCLIIV